VSTSIKGGSHDKCLALVLIDNGRNKEKVSGKAEILGEVFVRSDSKGWMLFGEGQIKGT